MILIDRIILFFSMFILVMAFEVNIYRYYFTFSAFGVLLLFFSTGVEFLNKSKISFHKILLFMFILSSFLFSTINYNFLYFIRALAILLVFFLCERLVLKNKNTCLFDYFLFISVLGAFISLFLQVFNGHFFIWDFIYKRNASLFFDPNYASAIFTCSALLSLIVINAKLKSICYFFLFSLCVFFTYSKAGALALLIGLACYLYCRYSFRFIFHLAFIILILGGVIIYMDVDLSMFRISQGLNSRDTFFTMVYTHVFEEFNFFGGDANIIENLISKIGLGNKSTHNYYLDLLLSNGIVPFFFLIPFLFYVLFRGIKLQHRFLPIFMSSLALSNSISISIGGIGVLSLIYTYSIVSILITDEKVI